MSEPILAEIQMFGFQFAPRDWLKCEGGRLPISQYRALDTLLAGRFGRDSVYFGLPNLMDSLPGGAGAGPDRTPRTVGDTYGEAAVQLKPSHLPAHVHHVVSFATREAADRRGMPTAGDRLTTPALAFGYNGQSSLLDTTFAADTLGETGGNQAHENRQPYLGVGFCIAVVGSYPQFS
ncbi:MAG: tail fiber protein [Alphaproteobacteria bacterium]|nr:tail fiber protein [Alphaproteobacteria bacterium]MBU2379334.1 tail fiber protein [Alphaproteobacteria bacterium]